MLCMVASGADLSCLWGLHDLCGDDAGGNGDDGIAHQHDDGCKELSGGRLRRDVAVTNGGQGDHGPVNADWDAGKAGFLLRPLNRIH